MNLWQSLKRRFLKSKALQRPVHLVRGRDGETAATTFLRTKGLKTLAANYRSHRGEIDLVMRDRECLVFVEVKTRSSEDWGRPSVAVDARKRRLISQTALDYLRAVKNPQVAIRFDIVEVLLENEDVREVRHIEGAFNLSAPYRYG